MADYTFNLYNETTKSRAIFHRKDSSNQSGTSVSYRIQLQDSRLPFQIVNLVVGELEFLEKMSACLAQGYSLAKPDADGPNGK